MAADSRPSVRSRRLRQYTLIHKYREREKTGCGVSLSSKPVSRDILPSRFPMLFVAKFSFSSLNCWGTSVEKHLESTPVIIFSTTLT